MTDRLTAMEIEQQQFRRAFRGYAAAEVRLYLKSVGEEVQRLNLQNGDQREELGRLRSRLEDLESRERSLQDALVAAQRLGDEMIEKSRAEAELVIREARGRAERLLQQSQDQLARIEDEIGRSRLERDTFERQLRSVLEQHLELLELRRNDPISPDIHILHKPSSTSHA